MTATQVFLRFIKEEYTEPNGEINPKKYNFWIKEINQNAITSSYIKSKDGMYLKPLTRKRDKGDFVDDFLSDRFLTLKGYMRNFLVYRSSHYCGFAYGFKIVNIEKNIRLRWRTFLEHHIEGNISSYWGKKSFTYKWKE